MGVHNAPNCYNVKRTVYSNTIVPWIPSIILPPNYYAFLECNVSLNYPTAFIMMFKCQKIEHLKDVISPQPISLS